MKIKDLLKDYLCESCDILVQFEIYQFDDILGSWEVDLQETYKLSELLDDTVKNSLIRSEAREILDSNVLDYFSKNTILLLLPSVKIDIPILSQNSPKLLFV